MAETVPKARPAPCRRDPQGRRHRQRRVRLDEQAPAAAGSLQERQDYVSFVIAEQCCSHHFLQSRWQGRNGAPDGRPLRSFPCQFRASARSCEMRLSYPEFQDTRLGGYRNLSPVVSRAATGSNLRWMREGCYWQRELKYLNSSNRATRCIKSTLKWRIPSSPTF